MGGGHNQLSTLFNDPTRTVYISNLSVGAW